ncbi:tripartite motif-containing protein 16-like, partial [Diretmus argenteus]
MYLKMVNNLAVSETEKDKLWIFRPWLDSFREKCLQVVPEEHNSVDEMMIPFKGRFSSIKQYMRGKPHPWGFKVWVRTGISGMMCDFDVYQGSNNGIRAKSELGLSGDVVMKLASTLPEGQNYKIYADNYFTSVPLIQKLLDHGIHYGQPGSKMAEQQQQQHGGVLDLDRFCCSVCLDLLKDPVTIHCGHSYCRICIEGCWDQEEEKGVFSCPQCRESFSPRPVLGRNNMLAEVIQNLKTTGGQQASPSAALVYAGPADVACDFCTGTRRHKAVMSCLACMGSYCETHLQPHYSVPVLQKHKLVSATARLQEETCSIHDKLMEVYCRTDQQCVCYLCTLDEHKGHNTVSVAAERAEKQKQLGVSQQEVQKRIQERERELKELSQAVKDLKSSAQTAARACDTIFTELIRSMERRCSEVKQLITAQEETAVGQAEELLLQLEEEIAGLRRRDTEMEELTHTDHHVHLILNTWLSLSENNRKVTISRVNYPAHPDRFTYYPQVLCREGLSGRCYWEVEWKGDDLSAAVSYKGISRTTYGNSRFGDNDKSWCLWWYKGRYYFRHNKVETEVSGPRCSRVGVVGVYLDHEAGTLSFYNISDTMTLLHKVCTTFTRPLYPGIHLWSGAFAELIKL